MKMILFVAVLMLIAVNISAVNHMDMITSMVGEHNQAKMGSSIASLDFNGDSYDDLIVCSGCWGLNNPPGHMDYGKIYFYWGGPDFDNIPDFVIEGTYMMQYTARLSNLGDVNGDGIEDLGVTHHEFLTNIQSGNPTFSIFFGRQTPSNTPDFTCNNDYNQFHWVMANSIGDINGDGFSDVGLVWSCLIDYRFQIMYGGSMNIITLFNDGSTSYEVSIIAVGDVNNDSYGDFSIGYAANNMKQVTLYYGGAELDLENNLLLFQQTYGIYCGSFAVGDVNNDSYDDFIGYEIDHSCRLWFGQDNLTTVWDVVLTPEMFGDGGGDGVKFGDVNNDGYSDIIGGQPYYSGDDGRAGLWLGGQNFNGTVDLYLNPPDDPTHSQFGVTSAIGDYNGDGCDDYAAGAPYRTNTILYPGMVYVYAGNAELADTTVGTEDEIADEPMASLSIRIYPNPVPLKSPFLKYTIDKASDVDLKDITIEVYNIKGQRVFTKRQKATRDNTVDLSDLDAGVYLLKFSNGERKITRKILIN